MMPEVAQFLLRWSIPVGQRFGWWGFVGGAGCDGGERLPPGAAGSEEGLMNSVWHEHLRKRDFELARRSRPIGARERMEPLRFVVQKHAGRLVHYDLRLEVGGVLKSWTIPLGPSSDPKEARLALMSGDHPLDCAHLEGTLPGPPGGHGTGEVIVWDTGVYSPDEDSSFFFGDRRVAEALVERGLGKGSLSLFFWGYKLAGSWLLARQEGSEQKWLLIKRDDLFAEPNRDLVAEAHSVVSGRTVEELREESLERSISATNSSAVAL